MKTISILGSTGSVGQSTVKVLQAQSDSYNVQALTAHQNWELLAEQAIALKAKIAAIGDEKYYGDLKNALTSYPDIEVAAGEQAIIEAASRSADWTMVAIVGMAGLHPLMASIEQGGIVAIANKEPLVAAGELVLKAAQQHGTRLLPVDSEHNAIFQVFEKDNRDNIEKIILTASGGPFRTMPLEEMEKVTTEQALAHPNWSMGAKISIDSATMMNKALEVIEAHHLFNMPVTQIDVVVHPQSVVHSMVEYSDGSILAQMGASDMCTPITYALGYPKRINSPGKKLDLLQMKRLDFESVDSARFPFVGMAYDAIHQGASACITMNAANEVAVKAFLNHKIAFLDIYKIVYQVLESASHDAITNLEHVIMVDNIARQSAESIIDSRYAKIIKSVSQ
jgi:1-deoxy-D-xylulose-5-phosphate reductoisomerase